MSAEAKAIPSTDPKVICLLDVLGFESMLDRIGLEGIHAKYQLLIERVREQRGGLDIVPLPDGSVAVGYAPVGNAYFSDSLLFWSGWAGPVGLFSFTQMIAEMICLGIEIALPLRGAIAIGESILESDSGIFLGKPLVEVARTERLQQWIGVSFGSSFFEDRFKGHFYLNTVLPFKSQYKDPKGPYVTGIAVDWPRRWRESRTGSIGDGLKSLDVDDAFSDYYRRTQRFVDFSAENHDWFKSGAHLDYG
jgi:hypothetical protein